MLNVAVKLLLAGLVIFSSTNPDLPQFAGKAMAARAMFYPWAALLIPAIWLLRGRPSPYPHLLDALIALPFLIDVAGNAANLYDTSTMLHTSATGCSSRWRLERSWHPYL